MSNLLALYTRFLYYSTAVAAAVVATLIIQKKIDGLIYF